MTKRKQLFSIMGILAILGALALFTLPFNIEATTTTPVLYGTNVPTADSTANDVTNDVIGNKTDAAAAGAVSETESIMAYAKQAVTNTEAAAVEAEVTDALEAENLDELLKTAVASSFSTSTHSNSVTGYLSSVSDTASFDRTTDSLEAISIALASATVASCVEKSDGAVVSGLDAIFVITGGPVRAKITGIITTILSGSSNAELVMTTTNPSATVDMNTAAVAIDNDAAGTSYRNVGTTSTFTPIQAGFVIIDPVTVEDVSFLLPIGTVSFSSSAAQTGTIKWYMDYVPLSPNSVVEAAS